MTTQSIRRLIATDAGWGPLALLAAAVSLALTGAGRSSLDTVLARR